MSNIVQSTEGFFIQNLDPNIGEIYTKFPERSYNGFDNNILILDYGKKERGNLVTCSLKFSGKFMNITGVDASCGCTMPALRKVADDEYIVTVIYDPNKIAMNISKAVTVIFDGNKQLKINLIINKN